MRNNYDIIADVTKVQKIINTIENSNLNVNEFTKKEFDALFKGNATAHSDFSLDWLRIRGVNKVGNVKRSCLGGVIPFVTLAREEFFEVPNKNKVKSYCIVDENNNEVKGYDENDFYTPKTHTLLEKIYGNIKLVETEKPIMGRRNYYKIDFNALKKVNTRKNDVEKYYEDKILKLSKTVAKYQKMLDAFCAE